MVVGAVVSLLLAVLPVVVVVALLRRGGRPVDGAGVRRFFQYVLLYGLLVVAATGVADGLARVLGTAVGRAPLVDTGGDLARVLTFTLVGLPLLAVVALWTRARLRADPDERRSLSLVLYLTAASLTAVVVAMVAGARAVTTLVAGDGLDAGAALTTLVWLAVGVTHERLATRLLAAPARQGVLVVGSAVGLVTAVAGLVALVGAASRILIVEPLVGAPALVLTSGPDALDRAWGVLVVGVAAWLVHWRRLAPAERTTWWYVHVLVLGVGGSLVLAVVGASLALHDVLVRWLGEPGAPAAELLGGTATAVAALVVGAVSWWYHRTVLGPGPADRTEVVRVHDYLLSGIALLAAACGTALMVVAALESLAPAAAVQRGTTAVDTLLAAVTLLVVGGPLWWAFWRRPSRAARTGDPAELRSPSRRVYLVLLFGVAGVLAVVCVLVVTFVVIRGLLAGDPGGVVVREARFPVGVLLAAAAVAAYHGAVHRQDRRLAPAAVPHHEQRFVLLVGAADGPLRAALTQRGMRVDGWVRDDAPPWSVDEVLAALDDASAPAVAVIADAGGTHVVPIHR